jgi:hypothetical protein
MSLSSSLSMDALLIFAVCKNVRRALVIVEAEFRDKLSDYSLFKKQSTPWSYSVKI